jgi:hypothetical protein
MSTQNTLLTSHKGVDLHAASAVRVMQDRLEGGDHLTSLHRCELHTWRDDPAGVSLTRLLDTGRYFNPNKHHYGFFVLDGAPAWEDTRGGDLAPGWPGDLKGTDVDELATDGPSLYTGLLGGAVPEGHHAVDVASWSRDQDGPVISGVLWRLVVQGGTEDAARLGESLAVARSRKQGLLINPHMEAWLSLVR